MTIMIRRQDARDGTCQSFAFPFLDVKVFISITFFPFMPVNYFVKHFFPFYEWKFKFSLSKPKFTLKICLALYFYEYKPISIILLEPK